MDRRGVQVRLWTPLLAALAVAACATAPPPRVAGGRPSHPPASPEPSRPAHALSFEALPGWDREDFAEAFAAYRVSCAAGRDPALAEICARARAAGPLDARAARAFWEANFQPEATDGSGVLTAYFAPEYQARRTPDAEFSAPLRPKPSDLVVVDAGAFDPAAAGRLGAARQVDGALVPYADRAAIESAPAPDALAWMRPEELFFLQIQGSGMLTFADGTRLKAVFAATNGLPFSGIANPMRDRGLLAGDNTSGEAIRGWLARHRGPEADAIMRLNARYVFFNLVPDDGRQPAGAAGLPLPAGRAIAVDPTRHAMGEVFWLDAKAPILTGAFPTYRRLVTALDTGGAIKGEVRADLFLGVGPEAGAEAGRVRHDLRMYRLVPRRALGSAGL